MGCSGCECRSKCMMLGDTEVKVANYQDFVGIIQIYWQRDPDIPIFESKIHNFCGLSARCTLNNYILYVTLTNT